ncbi:aerobic cobaltochelatase CobS subunit [Vibrio phage JSF23]|jgi:cobaltochelatase CobS|uniref:ATPase dynein-related AAA domain-containing protein n=4 Tax=Icepovirus bengalense TaxID=2846603 RepID=A0A076G4E2_9CAUD|nr:porphyrin biosynthesis [Vibrio phage ICP2]ADX87792.1 putative cobalamin biosynthesis protein CobS [Vibrio phage ICP2_2006_A]AII27086.1 hypothetical protein ICP22011A_0042 [Vibrio phage ICP2_2011_A]ASV43739.1 aerobic cobaltochelatase CobS subunit [Vibrio phage JSF23]ASV43835.1 aerobic cobaltochelatase CobS subunit [Vibrio phage JSF27]WJJ54310.1 porphyrin biosynthesis [Vibrio phage JPW]
MATMTTATSEALRSRVAEALAARMAGEARKDEYVTTAKQPEAPKKPTLFEDEIPQPSGDGVKEYAEIIGHPHPNGEFYFHTYKKEDWPEELQSLIPEIDTNMEFDDDLALAILMGIEYDKPVFAYGAPGAGKSVTPEQICARIGYPFMFCAGMGGTEPSDYVGSPWVSDGSMEWKDGPMSYAVRKGVFLLYDEPFKASAQTNMCIQSLLDTRRTLKLYGHPDPVKGNLRAHGSFRIMLADNVRGSGDQMDKFAAEIQDQSTLNRMVYKVHVPYPTEKAEKEILRRKFPQLTERLATKIVSLANMIRKGWEQGTITMPYSVRDSQELAEQSLRLRNPAYAFKMTYFDAVNDDVEKKELEKMWNMVKFDEYKL